MKKVFLSLMVAALLFGISCKTNDEINIDVTGSRWLYVDSNKSYDIEFLAGGIMRTHNPADTTPNNDFWWQNGYTVYWTFNNAYVTYTGNLNTDANYMSGSALNVVGLFWTWTATRY